MTDGNGGAGERERAALARLTANEKECLRRRLLPQTAKEMALDLRISPHAVEKRLKMARAKLGVSSSLAAARLLAAWEGYGEAVPRPPDLPGAAGVKQETSAASPVPRRWRAPSAVLAAGASLMILAALLALLPQAVPAPAPATLSPMFDGDGRPVPARTTDMNEAAAFIGQRFDAMDRDRSGFLDPEEASAMEPRDRYRDRSLSSAPPPGTRDLAGERKWMAKLDTDRDGRVSRDEFVSYMMPWTLLSGVPVAWRGARADAEAKAKADAARH